ncbi:dethiobiotin synthase [Pseudocolwellia agarivorans]|uniref:dethiobiotin synthase n=1 Tax=Pseudocolwellia agarivorans TaxID=1911682 RepID=UPI0009847BB2|nr:dethiobiotin synthase [Pseudocolwellia agarivorans]
MSNLFITATDTDAGKTFVATALVKALTNIGKTVAVYKPISAGCDIIEGKLVNEDAFLLQQVANSDQSITVINPIAFKEPIAPHIAAQKSGTGITVSNVIEHYKNVTSLKADITITEGAGGWRLPLGDGQFLSDFVKQSNQQVILVVNMKLGCLNHAVLTYESILADGLECVGWVANAFEGMNYLEENITELSSLLKVPMLAHLGNEKTVEDAADKFNLSVLPL